MDITGVVIFLVIRAVAVILAIVAVVYYVNSSESARSEAGTKYTAALGNANAGNAQVAILLAVDRDRS